MEKYLLDCLLNTYKGEDTSRQDSNIHVSDILDGFCPRKFALCIKTKTPFHVKKFFPVATKFTFEIGNAFQTIVTKRYNKAGILIGTWKCAVCGYKYFGVKETCPKCEKDLLIYQDTTLILDKYGIPLIGNVDVLAVKPPNEIIAGELKSIKPESFDELEEPELNHSRQIKSYLWLLRIGAKIGCKNSNIDISKYKINTNSGVVKYCAKTYKKMPFKSFRVDYDEGLASENEKKLEMIKNFTESKKMPKPVCNSKSNLLARDCNVREACFKNRKSL